MTHQPRIPEAAQSPYPLHPAPMSSESNEAGSGGAVQANADSGENAGDVGGLSSWASQNRIGLGTALGIGSAAIVAALLYTRYNRRDERDRRPAATRRSQGSAKAA